MPDAFALVRRFHAALLLALLSLPSAARAELPAKPAPQMTSGPAEALSVQQLLAIRLKREADPATRTQPPAETKLTAAPSRATPATSGSDAAANARVTAKLAQWQNIAHVLGPLPRAEWTMPWLRKPADRSISRPLTPAEAAARGGQPTRVPR